MTTIQKPIARVPVSSVGEALIVMREARALCLAASYHPQGGETCRGYTQPAHTVWVVGEEKNIAQFQKQLETK